MKNYETHINILALKLIQGLGNSSLLSILNSNVNLAHIQSLLKCIIEQIKCNKRSVADEIEDRFAEYQKHAESILSHCDKHGIDVLTVIDETYPAALRHLSDPPAVLFCKGNINAITDPKAIAIIGTRNCTETGYRIAEKTAEHFTSEGFVIVSGLARGIDTAAHTGALRARGITVAVVTDVQNIYPRENKQLAEEIISNHGILLAENFPGSKISKYHFISRDRLQSALSLGVFLMEAGHKSGALHAVKAAQRYQRPIFCPRVQTLMDKQLYKGTEEQLTSIIDLVRGQNAKEYDQTSYSDILMMLKERAGKHISG
ncbi:MAG: DNA protecting protein DprA [Planctomycetales bacterium 4572_13]|nr:MAG: DNA protecting protein DprA [Planctomycetales bacterium 4572_13]